MRYTRRQNGSPATKAGWVLFGTVLLGSVLATGARAEDWPRWGGPRGDETWRAPPIAEQWPAGGLTRLWRQPLGGGYGGLSSEAGRVYVQDRVTEPVEQERLLCLDANTGEPRWTYTVPVEYGKLDYGNGPRATPTLHDGKVYSLGALGHLACLEATTGRVVWRHELRETHQAAISTWGLSGSPVVYRDLLLVHVGGPGTCLVAFDLETGKERWRGGDDPAGYATPVVIDAPSGPLLICWTPEHIVGHLPDTGKVVWKIPYKITYGVS
ncbi:MAG: PQQ-binding-like beta-propeller repeat protein, partial [Planctomycetaceae bacterium]